MRLLVVEKREREREQEGRRRRGGRCCGQWKEGAVMATQFVELSANENVGSLVQKSVR